MVGREVQLVVGAVVPGDQFPVQPTFAERLEQYRRHLVGLVVAVEVAVALVAPMKFDDDRIVVAAAAVAVAVQQVGSSVIWDWDFQLLQRNLLFESCVRACVRGCVCARAHYIHITYYIFYIHIIYFNTSFR